MRRAAAFFPLVVLAACVTPERQRISTADSSVIQCPQVQADGAGDCEVLHSGGRQLLITATILAGDKIIENGSVLVDSTGHIAQLGCDLPTAADTTVLVCPNAIVTPGFVNAHDHIYYNHAAPSAPPTERYAHRHQWRLGLEGHTQPAYERATSDEQLAWSELRHVLAGTTSIAGMGGVPSLARNLEMQERDDGDELPTAFATVFPLGDAEGLMLDDGCDYPAAISPEELGTASAFQAHVAEGVDSRAQNEIGCVMNDLEFAADLPRAFVHMVGTSAADAVALRDADVSIVWSPRSNIALYGHTANVTMFDRLGMNIALSTDWLPSGSMNMLRELRCAADYSRDYLDGYFSSLQLWQMATVDSARSFALQDQIGSIAPGMIADIAVFADGPSADPYEDLIYAADSDMLLTLRAGEVLAGRSEILGAMGLRCDELPAELTCGRVLGVCGSAQREFDLESVLAANSNWYPLMACGAVPDSEPTCTPSWPGQFDGVAIIGQDDDGDGLANNIDNCPRVFNPPRPMDDGRQTDFDLDGLGDACDTNPLEQ